MTTERRFLAVDTAPIALEERQDNTPRIRGYAAVFYDGTPETQFELFEGFVERILPGAFDRAIDEDDVRALFNHDPDHILGRSSAETLSLEADETGLRYDIATPDTTIGRDVAASIKRRDVTGSSFSFVVTDEDFRREGGVRIREIRGVQLFDVGPVTFPAYQATTADARARLERASEGPGLATRLAYYRRRARLVEIDGKDPAIH